MADFILDPGEVVVERINRYWFDLVAPFVAAILVAIAAMFDLFFFPGLGRSLGFPVPESLVLDLAGGLFIIAILIVLSALYVFIHNYILVTNEHLIKVQQSGLLARQTSELGLGNIEDVKGGRRGIFGTLFDYGDIEIQTAGASENFIFRTTHHPQLAADRLLQYKEEYRRQHAATP